MKNLEKDKVFCEECYAQFRQKDVLFAQNPFEPDYMIQGCPECKSVDSILMVCDEPGCKAPTSFGWPTKDGYRNTCGKHGKHWRD